jgi:DNA-binding CsgD family transcriptional regulator
MNESEFANVIKLSDREHETFLHLADGCTTREMAARMSVSVKTVEAHVANIKVKLALENHTQVVRAAVRYGAFRETSRVIRRPVLAGPVKYEFKVARAA